LYPTETPNKDTMRILITGAAGYLGQQLLKQLAHHELTGTDIVQPPSLPNGVKWVTSDITDEDAVRDLPRDHDAIIHTVALVRGRQNMPISRFLSVMVGGTWNMLEAARINNVPRFVHVSSIVAGGWPSVPTFGISSGDVFPLSAGDLKYGLSKRLAETIGNSYTAIFDNTAVAHIRPAVIAGDGANPDPKKEGTGPFIHVAVQDVARAIRMCVENETPVRGAYSIIAARADSGYNWQEALDAFGFKAEHNWDDIPIREQSPSK